MASFTWTMPIKQPLYPLSPISPVTMSFTNRLVDSKPPYKKRKHNHNPDRPLKMSLFAPSSTTRYLAPPSAPSRKRSQRSIQLTDIDDFLSSDLEASFASTVSINSPPRDPVPLTPQEEYAEPMDISPAPPSKQPTKTGNRPRAFTSAARLFGNDLSNDSRLMASPDVLPLSKPAGTSSSKRTQRAALPMEWLVASHDSEHSKPAPPQQAAEPTSPGDDAMDVDTSFVADQQHTFSPPHAPVSAAPTITTFNHLFYDTMSPRRSLDSPAAPQPKKRRSLSPEPVRSFEVDSSSSPLQPSPSQSKLERMSANSFLNRQSKPTLPGLGAPSALFSKRPRRPVLSAMVSPSDLQPSVQSAYPILTTAGNPAAESSPKVAPPVRRAFSALIPQPNVLEGLSDESSFDGPDMSSPAHAYAKRQQVKTIRRCDGTEDFRPLTGATAIALKDSPSSRFMSAGMPGFGDNESYGKILPCHRVREDGLMRINCETLIGLLDGKYDSQIVDYHIIDCRFDYEYTGGHIPGAVNINTTAAVEDFLLGSNLTKPKPSTSGDTIKKTVLVFHCEFSAKRAPTFAKHLRAKDRSMNNHVYPKIHFPEVYILEGGYCQYFKTNPLRCEPRGYITMDDPMHAASRREDLDQFRRAKFGRHKSYTYGDGLPKSSSLLSQQQQQQHQKRNTAPSGGPNAVFAAANAARSRRGGPLTTLQEDANTTAEADDTDTDIGDSPCPPPTKAAGALKGKRLARIPLLRAETYNPARMAY